ncbi:alpha-glucosidase [Planococcus sp. ISL-109]|uniref:glycoside hydrolase family 13 protein n=1 Tax=Planococcus sp. ISL-109 TaxID=2819166 RepID=UPI001BE91BFC|nr:alpha-glucosidase [Planococcus sp. ISL-109]MBT2583385.1 alpha-glucosidase [Planococcus sp. ISL-109]
MTEWWKQAVVYQIYPRSFMDANGDGIGDLRGIISKLDYLAELGVDVLWLSPVYDSPNDDNGYDIRDYQKIMQEFGTMEDFDQLLTEIHQRGMRLVMDLVVNHTSDEHAWFTEHPDYYIWKDEPNNWRSFFSGSAWEYDEVRQQYYLHLFSKKQPDLNWENEALRKEVYGMMRWWLDKGVDGFRMDVINMISKNQAFPDGVAGDGTPHFLNGPRVHEFLQEMNRQVLVDYDIVTVGEMPGATTDDAKLYTGEGRKELNMIFTFEHMNLDQGPSGKWDLQPLRLTDLKENLEKWQVALFEDGWNSLYWNNHDQPRIVSRFGNDGQYRKESAKMLATCLHFLQGTPYIYQGEELGMTNVAFSSIDDYRDIETLNMYNEKRAQGVPHEQLMHAIRMKSRDNARTPMQWDTSENAGFTIGEPWISVNPNYREIHAEKRHEPDSVFSYYRRLIALRKELAVMTEGDFELLHREDEEIFAYMRKKMDETVTVYCNFSETSRELPVPTGRVLIGNYPPGEIQDVVLLRPYEALCFYDGIREIERLDG